MLKIGDVNRFGKTRDIGAYLGLTPRRDQSGNMDKQLGITKCGDTYLRCLLVNAAQYIMGLFGPPGALREHEEKLRGTTGREMPSNGRRWCQPPGLLCRPDFP